MQVGDTFKNEYSGSVIRIVRLTPKRVVYRALTSERSTEWTCAESQIAARGYVPYRLTAIDRLCLKARGNLIFPTAA